LEDKLKEAWSDLSPYERRHSANQLIAGLQKAVLLFGETRTEAEDFVRPYNNICKLNNLILFVNKKLTFNKISRTK